VEGQLEESRALAKQMESLRKVGQSPDKLRVLKDLTILIPENTWLFNLRLSKQTLEVSGMSRSASDLIPLLEKSGWLQKTEFASPIVTDANKLEHFKIKAEIKGLEPGS
jgi:general secretion pathway protein L